jgi:putative MATE family efflux protein
MAPKPDLVRTLVRRLRRRLERSVSVAAEWVRFDRSRWWAIVVLGTPAMVTGSIFTVRLVADFFMISVALNDAAVAGLQFGIQYYLIGFAIALGLSSGTISLVARHKGADNHEQADFVLKQSLWMSLLLSTPMALAAWRYPEPLIGLLTDNAAAIDYGATYLSIIMVATICRFWSMVGGQGLSGCGDTKTPMFVGLATEPVNLVLNAILIFGLGPAPRLGIAGAAIGTVVTATLSALIFTWIFLSGRFGLRLRLGGKQWDWRVGWRLVRVGAPLAATRIVDSFSRFPFIWMLATLGTPVVAAYAIGRRVFQIALIPAWGYGTAASTFVGQHLGAEDEELATKYGWDSVWIAIVTQLALATVMLLAARPLVELFGTGFVDLSVRFIQVFAVGIVGFSVFQTLQGGLRGAGDTTWPLYGTTAGNALRLCLGLLALPHLWVVSVGPVSVDLGLDLGIVLIFVAILVDWYVRALVNATRFSSGRWKLAAEQSDVGARKTD